MIEPPVHMDDLKGDQRQLAELIGMDAFLRMVEIYGGSWVYIPMKKSITRANRDKQICAEFDGGNYRELALRYNLSENRIRVITEEKLHDIKKSPISGQINLFKD